MDCRAVGGAVMAQTKHEIQAILAGAGTEPRHRLGQNFMIDQNLVRLVADAGRIEPGELVIEVGPGTGTLTEELLARGANVLAVEIDRDLAGALRDRFAENQRFKLIEGDALAGKHGLNPQILAALADPIRQEKHAKLVANLPYNIASPLVIELLIAGVDLLALVVQKEVADRLRAKEGTEDYGPLTVMAKLLSNVEVLRKLPPGAFWPPPKVDSSLVRMERANRLGDTARANTFSRFVHDVFSARRKTLRKALERARSDRDPDLTLSRLKLDGGIRAETLAPEVFLAMFDAAASPPPTASSPRT
jgi:16S rRNA (adenine1518-N6/adenine1519-N6)-dimethyltransferase